MTKTVWPAGTMLYPLPPVIVTCGTMENPNALTVAWTGIVNSDPAMTYISVRPSRFSHDIIKNSKEFVINLTSAKMLKAADFCGVKSGRDMDKIKETGLTLSPCQKIKAPMIEQSPLSLECRVTEIKPLGSHDMFLAEIVAVRAEEDLLDENGRFALEKSDLVAFCHGAYYALGGKLGTFGFSVAKKKKRKQRIAEIKHDRLAAKKAKKAKEAKEAPKAGEQKKKSFRPYQNEKKSPRKNPPKKKYSKKAP